MLSLLSCNIPVNKNKELPVSEEDGGADDEQPPQGDGIVSVSGLEFLEPVVYIEPGTSKTLKYNIIPNNAKNKNVVFYSKKPSICSVQNIDNVVIVLAFDTEESVEICGITVDGGYEASCIVNVRKEIPIESVVLNKTNLYLEAGVQFQLEVLAYPEDTTYNQGYTWSTTDKSVAIVDEDGKISTLKNGKCVISVCTQDETISADCEIEVCDFEHLEFNSEKAFSIKLSNSSKGNTIKTWDGELHYSTHTDSATWRNWDGSEIFADKKSDGNYVLYLRGLGNTTITGLKSWSISNENCNSFILDGDDISCYGDIRSLLNCADTESVILQSYCFAGLLYNENGNPLIRSPLLPSTELSKGCYCGLFENCKLKSAPSLPAEILKTECYRGMFKNCLFLECPPQLPATECVESCYREMFKGCKTLTQPPELSATKPADYCCYGMFEDCAKLESAPVLPKGVAIQCYREMFKGCIKLKEAPKLSSYNILKDGCYAYMFEGCTSLEYPPLIVDAFDETLQYKPDSLAPSCYVGMFSGCSSLKQPLDFVSDSLDGVYAKLNCCASMFKDCISLKSPPSLKNIRWTAVGCFASMFEGCIELEKLPEINMDYLLRSRCFERMFYGCKKISVDWDYGSLYLDFSNQRTVNDRGETLNFDSVSHMFTGCSSYPNSNGFVGTYNSFTPKNGSSPYNRVRTRNDIVH